MVTVNLYDPQVAASVVVTSPVHLVILKLWHATGALYLWEYFTTLDYEWGVIRGRIPYRWTIWVYSLARVSALLGVIFCIINMNITTEINCQIWTLSSVFFFCFSATMSSLLIILRTIAIWNRNIVVLVLAITLWVANIAVHLQNVVRYRSVWVPAHLDCEPTKTDPSLLAFLPTILFDMVLLLIVFAGLILMRCRNGVTFGLTRLLWTQGIIWLIIGCAAEIPPLVLTLVHMNGPLRSIFEIPGVVIMTVAATRMHRSLVYFASTDVMLCNNLQESDLSFAKAKQTGAPSTVQDGVEIAMHKAVSTTGGDSTTVVSTKSTYPPPSTFSSHSISQTQTQTV